MDVKIFGHNFFSCFSRQNIQQVRSHVCKIFLKNFYLSNVTIVQNILFVTIGIAVLALGNFLKVRCHVFHLRNELVELDSDFGLHLVRLGFEKNQNQLVELHQLQVFIIGEEAGCQKVHDRRNELAGSVQHVASDDGEDDETSQMKHQRWIVALEELVEQTLFVRQNDLPGIKIR